MRHLISFGTIIIFSIITLILPESFSYGIKDSFLSLSNAINYLLENPIELNNKIFSINDMYPLLIGCIFFSIFFFIFLSMALFSRFYEDDNQNNIIKTISGFIILFFSIISFFAALTNYIEYKRIKEKNEKHDQIYFSESENQELLLIGDKDIIISDYYGIEAEKTKITIIGRYLNAEIRKIKKITPNEYKNLIKKRYSYKVKLKDIKEVKIKNNKYSLLEYKLNDRFYLDYIYGADEDIYIINFKLDEINTENLKVVKYFLIDSINIPRG